MMKYNIIKIIQYLLVYIAHILKSCNRSGLRLIVTEVRVFGMWIASKPSCLFGSHEWTSREDHSWPLHLSEGRCGWFVKPWETGRDWKQSSLTHSCALVVRDSAHSSDRITQSARFVETHSFSFPCVVLKSPRSLSSPPLVLHVYFIFFINRFVLHCVHAL